MQPKISVIIPCWHATEFLDRLYDSIQSQTFKDAEWIFVNDGDVSQNEKLQAMAEKDSAIRVIWKENGGASSARNVGIDEAKGEWIVFSDADDWFRPYYLERLYSAVKDSDADMAVGGFTKYFTRSNSYTPCHMNIEADSIIAMEAKDALQAMNDCTILFVPWNKIYKTSIIKENNLKFDLSVKVVQDGIFNLEYYLLCKKISLVKDCGYIYVLMDTTSLASKYDPGYGRDNLRIVNGYKNLLEINGFTKDEVDKLMINPVICIIYMVTLNPFRHNHPSYRQAIKEIKEYVLKQELLMNIVKEYRKQNNLGFFDKYMTLALSTRSAVAVYLMLKPVCWIRYKSPKFYVRLKSLIYGKK